MSTLRFVCLMIAFAFVNLAPFAPATAQSPGAASQSPPFVTGEAIRFRTKQVAVFDSEASENGAQTSTSSFRAPVTTVALSANGRRLQLKDAKGKTFWVGVWTVDRPSVAPSTSRPIVDCIVQNGVRGGKGCGS